MKKNLFYVLLIGLTIIITACADEETPDPMAYFEVSSNTVNVDDDVLFNNLSTDAESYGWNFGDGNNTVEISPTHTYTAAGNYTVTLTAYNKSKTDEFTGIITVLGGEPSTFNPYNYDEEPSGGWDTHYYTDYSDPSNDDWTQETTTDYKSVIADGTYTIENYSYDNGWFFWTNAADMPDQSSDFDIDIYYQVIYDDSTYGDGAVWGLDNSDGLDYFYYRYTNYENAIWSIYGDSESGSWTDWLEGGNFQDYNLLSVRKYQNKYYIFLNKQFIEEYDFKSFFGTKFGYYIAKRSKMEVSEYSINKMIFGSKKAAMHKSKTPTQSNGKGSGVMKNNKEQKLK